MATVLDEIVAAHRRAAALDQRAVDELVEQAAGAPPVRDFRAALAAPGLSVIAEVKRRSPSKGDLAPDLDPALLAKAYAEGGAAALSVLTDQAYFGGSAADLAAARAGCELPVLRKDFTVDERDVLDARLMGADAVLLIVAALSEDELVRFLARAREVGLSVLVEVHDEVELDRAITAGADIVGVNQRDLRTFAVDRSLAGRLRSRIPHHVVTVAESGIRTREDVPPEFDAVLVGESLVTTSDPTAAVRQLKRLKGAS